MKKQSIVKSGQSQIQCRSNGKMSTAGLNLWHQMQSIFIFPIETAQHVMLFSWIGSQNDRVFLFESSYRSA